MCCSSLAAAISWGLAQWGLSWGCCPLKSSRREEKLSPSRREGALPCWTEMGLLSRSDSGIKASISGLKGCLGEG